MSIVRYGEPLNIVVVARGHPYERDAFMAIFDDIKGVSASLVEQPAAARLMNLEALKDFDALVLYDMPGLDFRHPESPRYVPPDPQFKQGFLDLLDAGKGVVALHHAIAGWPDWAEYGELLGGRFLYRPGDLRGRPTPDSGYRHDAQHEVRVVAEHPVTHGLPSHFELTDEVYLYEVFTDSVIPLLRSNYSFTRDNFYSAKLAVSGEMYSNKGWSHPPGSDLVGWVKRARNSPLVYLQPGDGPSTYGNQTYRKLVENAIRWVASDDAGRWARGLKT